MYPCDSRLCLQGLGAMATLTNDTKTVIKFHMKNIFIRFGTLRSLLRDNDTHFYEKPLKSLLKKHRVFTRLLLLVNPKQVAKLSYLTVNLRVFWTRWWSDPKKIGPRSLMMIYGVSDHSQDFSRHCFISISIWKALSFAD